MSGPAFVYALLLFLAIRALPWYNAFRFEYMRYIADARRDADEEWRKSIIP